MTIKPLRDRVLVQRLEYKHPTLAVVGVVIHKGVVVAVGNGRRLRRKTKFEGMPGRPPMWFEDGDETGKVRPMRVKPGDIVEFSPRGQVEFELMGEPYVMIWEQSIYGTTNDSQSEAMLFQQSAGFDRDGNFMSGKETSL
jgi:co-chaperonin GroES (HSP10)